MSSSDPTTAGAEPKRVYLSWADFEIAVTTLATRAHTVGARHITGIARGGLPLAVAVSHTAGIPYLETRQEALYHPACPPDIFIIDDIADSGRTLLRVPDHRRVAVWVLRSTCPVKVFTVRTQADPAWIVFPWESPSPQKVAADQARYMHERNHDASS